MASSDFIRGRQNATRILTNKSGGSVAAGDLVIIGDGTNDKSFTTNTSARRTTGTPGVAMETIASNAAGLVAISGYVPKIVTSGAVTREHFLYTHSVAKQATAASQRSRGAFGQVLNSTTSPEAILWGAFDHSHELDYVAKTSDTSITATTEATANTVVTATAITYDGSTPAYIEFGCPGVQIPNVSGGSLLMYLYDDTGGGAASIGILGVFSNPATISASVVGARHPVVVRVRLTPSAASHTYSVRCTVTSGTGTIKGGAFGLGANAAAYIAQIKV